MSRRRRPIKRQILPDAKYKDLKLAKFMNAVMKDGKKSLAERIVYGALDLIKAKLKIDNPLDTFHAALENVRPSLEVKSRRVGGSTYQVPIEVPSGRAETLAMRWIITAARNRKAERTMREKLANELMDAAAGRGASVKKREDTHKMADANKAFAHFRW